MTQIFLEKRKEYVKVFSEIFYKLTFNSFKQVFIVFKPAMATY